jgi:hypothetical protein
VRGGGREIKKTKQKKKEKAIKKLNHKKGK